MTTEVMAVCCECVIASIITSYLYTLYCRLRACISLEDAGISMKSHAGIYIHELYDSGDGGGRNENEEVRGGRGG